MKKIAYSRDDRRGYNYNLDFGSDRSVWLERAGGVWLARPVVGEHRPDTTSHKTLVDAEKYARRLFERSPFSYE